MNALKPEPVSGKPVDVFGRLGHGSAGSDAASTASTHRHACACSVGKITEAFDAHAHAMELEANFPRCVPEPVFIDNMTAVLASHGFSPATAINLVSNCRDELCRSFTEYLDKKWDKPSFNIASLAGMVFCGRTGFKVCVHVFVFLRISVYVSLRISVRMLVLFSMWPICFASFLFCFPINSPIYIGGHGPRARR